MGKDSTRQGVLFKGLSKKSLVARFDQEQSSSDGGAVLLQACDERLGLSAAMAACLRFGTGGDCYQATPTAQTQGQTHHH